MARTQRELLQLLSDVYAAGLGEQSWADALKSLSGFFGAAGATRIDLDRSRGLVTAIDGFGVEQATRPYVERMNAINPRMHRALAQSGCHTSSDYDSLPESAIRRHEFYDWLTRECGVKYFIGSRMIDAGDLSSFVSVEFTARHGHAEADGIEMFRLMTPHLANAWRMSRRLARAAAMESLNAALQESVRGGVIGFDRRGRIVSLNGRASGILARGDGLRTEQGQLRALRAADDRALQALMARALRAASGEAPGAGGAVGIARERRLTPYGIRIMPVVRNAGSLPEGTPVVIAMIADPAPVGAVRRDDLMATFGLTPREAELTALLGTGLTLDRAARRMQIARNTARAHLANVLFKTGTHGQSALLALILNLPPPEAEFATNDLDASKNLLRPNGGFE